MKILTYDKAEATIAGQRFTDCEFTYGGKPDSRPLSTSFKAEAVMLIESRHLRPLYDFIADVDRAERHASRRLRVLWNRICYDNRKGRSARRRLGKMGYDV